MSDPSKTTDMEMRWLWPRAPIEDPNVDYKYAVTIDSGSSGSRLEIYSWLDHEDAKNGMNLTEQARLPVIQVNGKQKKYFDTRQSGLICLECNLGYPRLHQILPL